ncbi:type II secretion system F family protein [Mitsuokella sp. AF21-1AC]|uniref:type II secretion system F family protein n=1 Tax=Mitsuokella sp. AF21-1AC TaxID=2292235 RepID=UPI000E497989|nr:type II secretion system F family protein [Mitsuokella sp. AF21-1AC]RGS72509.1 secretion system protein F [Mitsuokella sp. AF21-1AC]
MKALLAIFIAILCFGLLLMLLSIRSRSREDHTLTERMNYFAGVGPEQPQQAKGASPREMLVHLVESISSGLGRIQKGQKLELLMQQADWPLHGTEFEAILLLWGLLVGFITFLVTLKGSMFFIGAIVAILLGFLLLALRIRRRRKKFTNQLGDMLTMVANALRAGFSFMQAFELISREMDAPMGKEVRLVVNEVNLGNTLETALDNMQKRVASPDFELVVTAVLIQRQVGGDLAQILDTISETIQERIRMRREVMTLTAQGRASALVVSCIPIGVAAALSVLNPNYLKPLLETEIGRMFIVGAVILQLIGFIIIHRIVDIRI